MAIESQKLLAAAEIVNGVKVICRKLEKITRDQLRAYVDELRGKGGSVALLLAAVIDDKVALIAAVTKDVQAKVKASDSIREAAKVVGGGGGGRPDLAEAGARTRPRSTPPSKPPSRRTARRWRSEGRRGVRFQVPGRSQQMAASLGSFPLPDT